MHLFWIVALLPLATAMLGYDCGGEGMNITSLSLLDIGTCEMDDIEPNKEEAYIQLMQLSDFDKTTVTQCKIEVDRTIYYCGMHSHIAAVNNGRREYIQEIGEQACRRLHETRTIQIASATIDLVARNGTTRRGVILAGSLSVDGRCAGTQYSDGYGTWENVVVQASVKITLRSFEAPVKRSTGYVMLPSGTQCRLSNGFRLVFEGAETFWSLIPTDSCHFDQYDILYEGLAVKLTPRANQTAPILSPPKKPRFR